MDTVLQLVVIGYFATIIALCVYAIFFLRSILKDLEIEVRSE